MVRDYAPRMGIAPRVAIPLGAYGAIAAATVALQIAVPKAANDGQVGVAVLLVPFAIVGLLLVARKPENAIGWIFVAMAFLATLSLDAAVYSVMAWHEGYHLPLARLATAMALAGFRY